MRRETFEFAPLFVLRRRAYGVGQSQRRVAPLAPVEWPGPPWSRLGLMSSRLSAPPVLHATVLARARLVQSLFQCLDSVSVSSFPLFDPLYCLGLYGPINPFWRVDL